MAAIKLIAKPSAMASIQFPPHCTDIMHWKAFLYHSQKPLACLYDREQVHGPLNLEGFYECHTRLRGAPLQAGHNPGWGKEKAQVPCSVLAGSSSSVHHSLIQFSVEHYHAPPCFHQILQSLYSDLVGKVITNEWETPPNPLWYWSLPGRYIICGDLSYPVLPARLTCCSMQMILVSWVIQQQHVSTSLRLLSSGYSG